MQTNDINIINQNKKTPLEVEHQQNIAVIKLSDYSHNDMVGIGDAYVLRFGCNVDVKERRKEQ